jgi:hypothetical protein
MIVLWWVAPLVVATVAGGRRLPFGEAAAIWSGALGWMGLGCALNARRCHRLHCYISGPALLLGAVACALIATGLVNLGPRALAYTTWSALGLTAASFLPEIVWRRYA